MAVRYQFKDFDGKDIGPDPRASEMQLAASLYRNRGARRAWLEISEDAESLVNVLRSPEDLHTSRASGSIEVRGRINKYLERLDELRPGILEHATIIVCVESEADHDVLIPLTAQADGG